MQTERLEGNVEFDPQESRKVIMASIVGTAIEWYDFFLFGTAAATVFNVLFFPSFDPLVGTIAALGAYAVAYFVRPLGGIVFGHLGDRLGRKNILVLTLLMMGLGTFAIGLLPTYESIGVWAAVLLVLLRVVQGLAIGGEWGGAVLLAVEHAPKPRWGLVGSWPQIGSPIGMLMSTGAFALVSQLPEEDFLSWGWRLPFLFSLVLVIIGLAIRLKISESPIFVALKQRGAVEKMPLVQVLKKYPVEILLGVGIRFSADIIFITANIFALSYATSSLDLPRSVILQGIMLAAALQIFMIPFYGWLGDRIGRHNLYALASLYTVLVAFIFFPMIDTRDTSTIMWAYVLALPVGFAATYGLLSSLYADMFEPQVRFTGISLVYQIAGIVTAGPAPIIAAMLFSKYQSTWPIALYIGSTAVLSLVCVLILKQRKARALAEEARVGRPAAATIS